MNVSDNTLCFKARNANVYCGCGNHCWLVVVGGELLKITSKKYKIIVYYYFVFFTRYFSKWPTRIDFLLMPLLQIFFRADA